MFGIPRPPAVPSQPFNPWGPSMPGSGMPGNNNPSMPGFGMPNNPSGPGFSMPGFGMPNNPPPSNPGLGNGGGIPPQNPAPPQNPSPPQNPPPPPPPDPVPSQPEPQQIPASSSDGQTDGTGQGVPPPQEQPQNPPAASTTTADPFAGLYGPSATDPAVASPSETNAFGSVTEDSDSAVSAVPTPSETVSAGKAVDPPPQNTLIPEGQDPSGGKPPIAGIVVGVILGILALSLLLFFLLRRRRRNQDSPDDEEKPRSPVASFGDRILRQSLRAQRSNSPVARESLVTGAAEIASLHTLDQTPPAVPPKSTPNSPYAAIKRPANLSLRQSHHSSISASSTIPSPTSTLHGTISQFPPPPSFASHSRPNSKTQSTDNLHAQVLPPPRPRPRQLVRSETPSFRPSFQAPGTPTMPPAYRLSGDPYLRGEQAYVSRGGEGRWSGNSFASSGIIEPAIHNGAR